MECFFRHVVHPPPIEEEEEEEEEVQSPPLGDDQVQSPPPEDIIQLPSWDTLKSRIAWMTTREAWSTLLLLAYNWIRTLETWHFLLLELPFILMPHNILSFVFVMVMEHYFGYTELEEEVDEYMFDPHACFLPHYSETRHERTWFERVVRSPYVFLRYMCWYGWRLLSCFV
ncbi:hypothetical protein DFH27DRAFT_553342 [Peziza echinospora]|nr:hypothetical protein DFH27DRAFT_553342 [Peziza echinospora]